MERQVLLDHLRATHFESGNRDLAMADARQFAQFLRSNGANRVVGIGSAIDASRPFSDGSNIDLAAWAQTGVLSLGSARGFALDKKQHPTH